jgi:asparagine synthase (glutamine-hydrolysing)
MCGIAGVVGGTGSNVAAVTRMVDSIVYRGADEHDVRLIGPATLGHARLAVVDRLNGKQPMSNEDGTVWVTFNGEIYNFEELREELKRKGHTFKSRCDTEVLVHLWEEEGEGMLDRLIGMFAFFLWDQRQHKGMLARDRQGIKPCYLADYRGGIAFASEIKALLSLPGFSKQLDKNTLAQVFAFNYPPPPATCFKGIQHLMPGTYLSLDGIQPPQLHTYWRWPLLEERSTPSFEKFEALLDDAVRLQMRFDVPGGMFLSGGVDSSVIASHLVRCWNAPRLEGIALDFNMTGFSELPYSQFVAKKLGIALRPFEVNPDVIPEIADKVVYHTDQPHGDFSFFLFYLLSREAHRQGKIVMFNGDGPDEALLGFLQNQRFFGAGRMNFSLESYFDVICYMNKRMRERLLTPEFLAGGEDPLEKFVSIVKPWKDLDPMEQVSAYELTSLMPGNNLVKGDRMGASWSIEGRGPFLDHRVSELLVRLPLAEKFKDGKGKHYLKAYALRQYPEKFIHRPKSMPTMPVGEWIKGPLYGWARRVLSGPDDGIFRNDQLLIMLDDHRDGKANHTSQLRTVITTKLWLKRFFG